MPKAAIAAVVSVLLAGAAGAAEPPDARPPVPENTADITFTETGDRLVKIDRESGHISICEAAGESWVCRLTSDDHDAYEAEIDALRAENEALSARVEALEAELEEERAAMPFLDEEQRAEFDAFLDLSDEAMRRFFGLVRDLRRDFDEL